MTSWRSLGGGVIATFAAFIGAAYLHSTRLATKPYALFSDTRIIWTLLLASLVAAACYALGVPDGLRTRRSVIERTLTAAGFGIVVVSLLQLANGSAILPRAAMGLGLLVIVPAQLLAWHVLGDTRAAPQRAFIVANPDAVSDLESSYEHATRLDAVDQRLRLVGSVSPDSMVSHGTTRPLIDQVHEVAATMIVLDQLAQNEPSIVSQAAELHAGGIKIRTVSLLSDQYFGKVPIAEVQRVSLLFDIGELHGSFYPRFRRVVDLVFVLAAFPLFAVVLAALSVLNRTWNPGPLFYRQERVGKGGVPFEIVKFRTMVPSESSHWTDTDDARITPVGRLLRGSHLDELPQIINIFRGELTLVGPRPEQSVYVAELEQKLPFYGVRHIARPGLTGWAQVNLGYTSDLQGALEKLQYELYYLRHQSLRLDLAIISKTFGVVLGRRGR